MLLIDEIAEQRIQQAMREGAFDRLPGAGRPLELDDDLHVPEELRTAYRLLRNAGYTPPEVTLRCEIRDVRALLNCALDAEERRQAGRRLNYLMMQLAGARAGGTDLRTEQAYYSRIMERI